MNSGPIAAMVWEGLDAVKTGRGKSALPYKLWSPRPLSSTHTATTEHDTDPHCFSFPLPLAILGATNPLASAPGTIRGDYALAVGRNVCHGSDSVESAKKEIALWFKEGELISWKSAQFDWVYE